MPWGVILMNPLKPEHANKVEPIIGTEFSTKRVLTGYSYPVHGNLHNPTPLYRWLLLLDGKLVDHADSKNVLVRAAREPDASRVYRA
jgi:hypothetical protein